MIVGKEILTQEITSRIVNRCAELFINAYKTRGILLMELVDIIGEIISLEDESIAKQGTGALFGGIIEVLNDTFILENRKISMQVMARVIWILANSPKGRLVKDMLNSLGIKSEAALLNNAYSAIEKRRFNGDFGRTKKVMVFSRITKGADVAINSIIMERMKLIFPNAEIILFGIPKDKELFGADRDIRIEEIGYERRGTFISRLNSWIDIVERIKEEIRDLGSDEYIVIDADTRISQVGVLPCTKDLTNYYFLLSTLTKEEKDSAKINRIGQVVNNWIDEVFMKGEFVYPNVSLKKEDIEFAREVKEGFNLKDRYTISISLGVGGAKLKKFGKDFDLELIDKLQRLIDRTIILLDKGTDEYDEPSYVTSIVDILRQRGKIIVDITYNLERKIYEVQYNNSMMEMYKLEVESIRDIKLEEGIIPDIISWHGSLGKFGGLIGISYQYVGYDSAFGHVAGALGISETIIFAGHSNNIFLNRWAPLNKNSIKIIDVSDERREHKEGILKEFIKLDERYSQVIYRANIVNMLLRRLEMKELFIGNQEFINVLMGIKKMSVVELELTEQEIRDMEYFLRVFKYTTGYGIKLFNLYNKRYCIYDEDYFRYIIQKGVAEGKLQEELVYLCATQSGLEQVILQQLAIGEGLFYELSIERSDSELEKFYRKSALQAIGLEYGPKLMQKILIDLLFIPSYKRPTALRRALELQTRNMKIFGHAHIPIIICSNANPDERARFMSDEDASEFRQVYGIDNPREKKWGELDMIVVDEFRRRGFDVSYMDWSVRDKIIEDRVNVLTRGYQKLYDSGNLPNEISNEIVENGRVDSDKIRKIMESILASNISGIRNFTILLGNNKRIISVDDDALPRIRVPKREVLERILKERDKRAKVLEKRFYEELSAIIGESIDDREKYFVYLEKAEELPTNAGELIKKYYLYSEDGRSGLIPQMLGQIIREADTEDYWRFNEILKDVDNIYCGKLPDYLIVAEDTMMQDVEIEYQYDEWDVDYMRVLSETLGSLAISPGVGWVFSHDKRGVAGNIAGQNLLRQILERRIGIATTHFNYDQDWSGEALLDSFIGRGAKITDLQRVTRKAIHLEVGGFSSLNAQFCFNTTSIDNTVYPVPTIGELYRTEEPYYSYLVGTFTGRIVAWCRTVGGHHRMDVSTRPNVPHQIVNEEVAMVAWRLYDMAVKDTKEKFGNNYANPSERMRYLGRKFIEYGRTYKLDEWARDRLIALQERMTIKINNITRKTLNVVSDVRDSLNAVSGELIIEFIVPKAMRLGKDTFIYPINTCFLMDVDIDNIARFYPIKIRERRIGEQRERIVDIIVDRDNPLPDRINLNKSRGDLIINLSNGTDIAFDGIWQSGKARFIAGLNSYAREEFLNNAMKMVKAQVVNDGLTLLFWPDLIVRGQILDVDRHSMGESEEQIGEIPFKRIS